jgi:hypothetical protein
MVDVAMASMFGFPVGTLQNNIKDAHQIIDEICEAASHWPQIAKECDVPKEMVSTIVPNFQPL